MNKKCKVCGYKFKSSDENICPECFTSREDDISCSRYTDDLHSHSCGYNSDNSNTNNLGNDIFEEFERKEKSFIDEQRRDETDNPIPSSTYSKSLYESSSDMSSRQQKLMALKNAGSFSSNSAPDNYSDHGFNSQQSYGYNPNKAINSQYLKLNHKKSNQGCLISLLLGFLIPLLVIVTAILKNENNDKKDYHYDHDFNIDYSFVEPNISLPDMSIADIPDWHSASYESPDGSFTLTLSNAEKFNFFNDINSYYSSEENSNNLLVYDDSYSDKEWHYVKFDLFLNNNDTILIDNVKITASDIHGNIISDGYIIKYNGYDEYYEDCQFIVPSDAFTFRIYVPVEKESNLVENAELEMYDYQLKTKDRNNNAE